MTNFFTFSDSEKQYLESITANNDAKLSPYAAKNSTAVRNKRPKFDIIRPPYSYDVDLVLYNPLYNRYADKTQVFSFYKNDDITKANINTYLYILFIISPTFKLHYIKKR